MLGHVAVQVVAATLGMAHLAQDAAVGARDALDGECGAVGVDGEIHAGLAVLAHVLRGDLAVGDQLGEYLVVGDKAALAVADGDGVGVVQAALRQPRGQIGRDASAHQTALVAADGVKGQRGRIGRGVDDVTIGHQTELDQSLEAVADAQHQTVAGLEQVADCLGDLGSAEERRDELGGAVGLVAAREAAGDHDDLACTDATGKLVGALGDGLGREVVDHEGVGLGTGCAEGAGAVVLAVVAGEHGDDHARAGDLGAAVHVDILGAEVDGLDLGGLAGAAVGEDALDAALPGLLELGELDDLGAGVDDVALNGGAQGLDDNAVGDLGQLGVIGELDDKAAVEWGEEALHVHVLGKLDADLVADAHLKEALGAAAVAGRGDGQGVAGSGERLDGVKRGEQLLGIGAVVLTIGGGGDTDDAVCEALELGGDSARRLAHGDSEADQGRRNVELAGLVLKRAAHRVLAADGAGTQIDLGHKGA